MIGNQLHKNGAQVFTPIEPFKKEPNKVTPKKRQSEAAQCKLQRQPWFKTHLRVTIGRFMGEAKLGTSMLPNTSILSLSILESIYEAR